MSNNLKDDGVVAGSFDPPHNGHLWLIEHGAEKYAKLHVVVAQSPDRSYEFSLDERLGMINGITEPYNNIIVGSLDAHQFLVDYATENNVGYILRGLRNEEDFRREQDMWFHNLGFAPEVVTEFLMPPEEYLKLSSTMIRELVHLQPWEDRVRPLVPEFVYEKLVARYGTRAE